MSFFRMPVYLDQEALVPLANYHDIDVTADVAVTVRDLAQRGRGGGLSVGIPGMTADLRAEGGTESEVTQQRTIKAHPTNALNRLIDVLHQEDLLSTDLSATIHKHQFLEIDSEWVVSPATEAGSLLQRLLKIFIEDPTLIHGKEPPMEVVASFLGSESYTQSQVVLEQGEIDDEISVIVLLNGGNIVANRELHDLEGNRTVFGSVEQAVAEGRSYSLEKYFLAGMNRQIRRSFNSADMLKSIAEMSGRDLPPSMSVDGPVVVVRAIAIY